MKPRTVITGLALGITILVVGLSFSIVREAAAQASVMSARIMAEAAISTIGKHGGLRKCITGTFDSAAMTGSPSFEVELQNGADNEHAGYDNLTVFATLTDADTSITQLDITCTVSVDNNTTDATPQVCDDVSDGVCTLTGTGVWQKASPGSITFPYRMGISGFPDIECTFTVGAGSATASVDTMEGTYRLCTM